MCAGSRKDTGGLFHSFSRHFRRAEFGDLASELELVAIQRAFAIDLDRRAAGVHILGPGNVVAFDLAVRDFAVAQGGTGFAGELVAIGLEVPGGGDGVTLDFVGSGPFAVDIGGEQGSEAEEGEEQEAERGFVHRSNFKSFRAGVFKKVRTLFGGFSAVCDFRGGGARDAARKIRA